MIHRLHMPSDGGIPARQAESPLHALPTSIMGTCNTMVLGTHKMNFWYYVLVLDTADWCICFLVGVLDFVICYTLLWLCIPVWV
jgi:hypothetical protein